MSIPNLSSTTTTTTTTTASKTTSPPTSSSATTTVDPNAPLIHKLSLFAAIACPTLILLPPRKLDVYTIALLAGTFASGNQLARDYTGQSLVERARSRTQRITARGRSREVGEKGAGSDTERGAISIRDARIGLGREEGGRGAVVAGLEAAAAATRRQEDARVGVLGQLAMEHKDKPEWKVERDRREKEAAEEGRGYGDLIMDQIWEVWNWGRKEVEELKEVDERVVSERSEGGPAEKKN